MNEWINEYINGWMNELKNKWMSEWTYKWMNVNEWKYERIKSETNYKCQFNNLAAFAHFWETYN